ncbi:hypothetical protein MYCTH_2303648 [Thermothelomyces thermophilus ATCC 42464]|uniref:RRM domain-containing protein n=1 Tax=Thermothelomyces thermophilus (strain ATCC 42464 / BCRC 31852 / DSM 1799) TaxID=573729 RepID=G2QD87_THET4|nr:uncharacterized protein MYCTH_2303648 [Thermothelomyces thermophilus ATCC 42464]AEO57453.1 hypothetical protein MYCTH_2303648 [Thermothelomyces thermophilus ATCC 42464]
MGNSDKKRQREAEEAPAGPGESAAQTPDPPSKKARLDSHRQLFVRSLPPDATSESLVEFFSQHYPVKHATVVLDPKTKTSRGYGFVSFADPEDAAEAKEKLKNELFHGRRLQLDIALPRLRDASKVDPEVVSKTIEEKRKREAELELARKPPKLIIRNLPWSIKKPEQLAKLFQSFGKVKFVDLPNDKGKLAGFGFVTLRGRKNAERAMEAINGKVVDGRTLAVDWAVDKQTWEKLKDAADQDEAKAKSPKEKKSEKAKSDKKEEDEDDDPNMTQEDRDLVNFFKNYGDNLEDEEEEDDQESEEDDEEKSHGEEDQDGDSESGEEEEEDQEEDEDSESDVEESDDSDDEEDKKKPKKPLTDNSTTIFIRNLPYSTTDETLKAHFTRFGRVRYARVVMDRTTEKPAGTGFVCFVREEDFKACLKGAPRHKPAPMLAKHSVLQDETADPEGNYTLDGRVLQVTQAVSKDEAARLAEESKGRRKEDKRRLFLLSEGAITPKSPLYSKLTPAEIKMREASAKQRKKLIESNPSLHLSLTRLAVRNIPHSLSSKDLKALARRAIVEFAKDVKEGRRLPISKEERERGGEADREAERRRREKGKGVVRQAKIVFETAQGSKVDEKTGGGRSRGYGFIEYWSHRRALMGLRYLNGHPLKNEAGKTPRLIVEFAIENAKVVQRRRQQEEKSRMAKEQKAAGGAGKDGKGKVKGKGNDKKEKGMEQKDGSGRSKGKGSKGRDGKDGKGGKPGKGAKPGKGGKKSAAEAKAGVPPAKQGKKKADEKLALRTKIIARKRMMRKKKAAMRAGKR